MKLFKKAKELLGGSGIDLKLIERIRNNHPELTELNLVNKKINDDYLKILLEALENNNVIYRLNLGENRITHTGAQYLADMLNKNETIIDLRVNNNKIGDGGGKVLMRAVRDNRTIIKIDLSNCGMASEGASWVGNALKFQPTLASIKLNGNDLTSEIFYAYYSNLHKQSYKTGIDHLLDTIKFNRTLTEFATDIENDACEANIKSRDEFIDAITGGDLLTVKKKIAAGDSVFVRDEEGNTLLHIANLYEQKEMCDCLLAEMKKHHTNPLNLRNYKNETPSPIILSLMTPRSKWLTKAITTKLYRDYVKLNQTFFSDQTIQISGRSFKLHPEIVSARAKSLLGLK